MHCSANLIIIFYKFNFSDLNNKNNFSKEYVLFYTN